MRRHFETHPRFKPVEPGRPATMQVDDDPEATPPKLAVQQGGQGTRLASLAGWGRRR